MHQVVGLRSATSYECSIAQCGMRRLCCGNAPRVGRYRCVDVASAARGMRDPLAACNINSDSFETSMDLTRCSDRTEC